MSKLYIVGTPIGNLSDFSPRGKETLEAVDFIAAEDTRVTLKLLSRFGISKPMVSYYEHNLRERGEVITARILAGESCAIVTDAGMPCISDPGEELVKLCAQKGIDVVAIPGPSAAITALALSGLDTSRFSFEGFLTTNKAGRRQHLEEICELGRTLIFYEAPHKLRSTLKDMLAVLGDRKISLCRELTKIYEEVIRTTLSEAIIYYSEVEPKGEFVLIIEGAAPKVKELPTLEEAASLAARLMDEGMKPSIAAKEAAAKTGLKKADIYRMLLEEDKQ